ncbi:MAG: hypothetical protein JNJ41_12135 [Bacteroidia bacterium]|jgi:hypothetical protein|nr:hypothetical protein [Sphingobacteriaceae bacterium]MBL7911797.1 hypothetical protein [Bacteroidia bacterium]
MKTKAISINSETLFMSLFQENKNSNDSDNHYIPGACNIGHEEIKRRKKAAIFSIVLTITVIVLIFMLDANKIWRLTLFIPATSLGVSFQQWYFKFCVAFGIKGVFNFGDIGKTFSIDQKENYRKDRIKAWQMIISGIVFGLILALIFYFMP